MLGKLLSIREQGRIQDFRIGGGGLLMKDEQGGAVHLRPIQRAGVSWGVLSAFGRFNERGGGGGGGRVLSAFGQFNDRGGGGGGGLTGLYMYM